ncbi:hypothetical protein CONLIGDRAFT_391142 [Coniochaeta ligniaria NRRL 30616]|uniref:FHA domain-containing protein n=1 Tax=Coniochaeta ligniaria NRRL 30616 TaxID=1408157 RepID=A0A1J7IMR7_9PEZI|nr:hypothetical protein CONLIGDRAFT_391142 [Coniochaeta ligniaria NRRL 30616]
MESPLPSSPSGATKLQPLEPSLPSTAGVKRPAPSLLPAFEPLSSSPGLPRPAKRQALSNAYTKYPTPVPTSSTGILSSSPPRVGPSRPAIQRTLSSVSERAPLSALPSVELDPNGETILMGRSSNSSHFQLSANRLISRVHVKARYVSAATPLEANKVEIVCNGWNGLKLHCQGRTWDLGKGDTFTSETEGAELMIDVQDARVLVQWPKDKGDQADRGNLTDSSWDDSPRSVRGEDRAALHGSPLRRTARIESPESPTPANVSSGSLRGLLPDTSDQGSAVQIYEDEADEPELPKLTGVDVGASMAMTEVNSFSSDLSDPLSDAENDPDEENDPIVHSFGPFGANLNSRLASITAASPKRPRVFRGVAAEESPLSSGASTAALQPSKPNSLHTSPKAPSRQQLAEAAAEAAEAALAASLANVDIPTVTNHVINQLAFSRLSSNPLTGILNNLPAEERKDLTKDGLRSIIEKTPCVGIIPRQGKDAAGKPLESEYYYIPEMDADENRRLAVTDGLRKPSLRNCRKQHKQYYWKRPRTP